jgi:hypothetical protein
MMRVLIAIAALAALVLTSQHVASAALELPPAPKAAVAAAVERAIFHYADPQKIRIGATMRSGRDRRWSLVTGSYGRRGLWAGWVRRTAAGKQRVVFFRTRDFDPGTRPPCDIRPAFTEPACPQGSASGSPSVSQSWRPPR